MSFEVKADVRDLHSDPHGDSRTSFFVSVFLGGVVNASFYIINVEKRPSLVKLGIFLQLKTKVFSWHNSPFK